MTKTLLVPLDGSALAERAVPYAGALARALNGWVVLTRVVTDLAEAAEEAADHERMRQLESAAARLRREQVQVETCLHHVGSGSVGDCIGEAAQRWNADLIVMATHARGEIERWIHGSVAEQVLRVCTVPLLLVPPACEADWRPGGTPKTLVPLDDSTFAAAALAPAAALTTALGGELLLVRVVESAPYALLYPEQEMQDARAELDRAAGTLREAGLSVTTEVLLGNPTDAVVTAARDHRVDLIVMSTHARGGLSGLLMGSVASATVERATMPVVLVRPQRADEASPAQTIIGGAST